MTNMRIGEMEINRIILGTSNFGTAVNESMAEPILTRYFADGGNVIDSARAYGAIGGTEYGAAERIVGSFLARHNLRDKVCVMTKGCFPEMEDYTCSRLNAQALRDDLEASLDALKTDYIDVYFLHRDDLTKDAGEIMEMLHPYVESGKIRALGCSNWTAARILEANRYAYRNQITPFAVSQIHWSLASTTPQQWGDLTLVCMNDMEYDFYEMTQMPIIAYASHAKGYFAKGVTGGLEALSEKARSRFDSFSNRARISRVRTLTEKYGVTAAACAISYIISNSLNAAALVGCSNVEQLAENMAAKDLHFDRETLDWLRGRE